MKYEINVARYVRQTATFMVEAENEVAAETKALELANRDGFDNSDVTEGPIVEGCNRVVQS